MNKLLAELFVGLEQTERERVQQQFAEILESNNVDEIEAKFHVIGDILFGSI